MGECIDKIYEPIFLSIYIAFTNGVLERIIYPTDTQGQICGYKASETRPYLFYFDLTRCMGPEVLIAGCLLTKSICVSHCPNDAFSVFQLAPSEVGQALRGFGGAANLLPRLNTTKMICLPDIDKSSIQTYEQAQLLTTLGKCASYYVPSGGVLGRCLPGFKNDDATGKIITAFDDIDTNITVSWNQTVTARDVFTASTWIKIYIETRNVFINIAHDYTNTWRSVLGGFGLSALLALAWVVLIRFIAGPLFLLSFLASVGGLIYGAYYCYFKYTQQAELAAHNHTSLANDANFDPKNFDAYMANPSTWMTLGRAASVLDMPSPSWQPFALSQAGYASLF
ncbi:hypothetical protein RvY_12453-1 [Ramazzottius varieornatus]|uniref:Uncharacterized protein n=1 Tax=Ramazzottius varieornatus TaxID=947166 RepID=A0A1D1VJK0_RAMVA|nr:hypothetical protein RvY_12453-1 [Ramazzottius varieornatus]